jgi:hypothetical protein
MTRVRLCIIARARAAAGIGWTNMFVTVARISIATMVVVVARIVSPSRIEHTGSLRRTADAARRP